MAIGDHVRKYHAQKAAEAAGEDPVQDPKHYMKKQDDDEPEPAQPSMAAVLAKMTELIAMVATAKTDPEKDSALKQVELMERLINKTRPENPQSPGISVYSYPEGELAAAAAGKVKALRCQMTWVGYELNEDTLKPLEVDLLNQIQPGEFRVTKADGTRIPFKVSAKHSDQYDDATGRFKVERLDMWFPCRGDHRANHMSMIAYLQQVLFGAVPTADELLSQIAKLKAELASAKAGVVGAVA